MLNTHGSLESCRHYQSIEMYVAEGFCAVDYSIDFVQVTWCMMTYITIAMNCLLREPDVFESDILTKQKLLSDSNYTSL